MGSCLWPVQAFTEPMRRQLGILLCSGQEPASSLLPFPNSSASVIFLRDSHPLKQMIHFPLEQFCRVELSVRMEMFYICAVQ